MDSEAVWGSGLAVQVTQEPVLFFFTVDETVAVDRYRASQTLTLVVPRRRLHTTGVIDGSVGIRAR